ncbi:MAG: transferrin-binding protein-like solute binding protein [Bacteroidetes bacterium]|nr:transferrin-binding protein-like solute binding protein [Bacteroidota bacterium]
MVEKYGGGLNAYAKMAGSDRVKMKIIARKLYGPGGITGKASVRLVRDALRFQPSIQPIIGRIEDWEPQLTTVNVRKSDKVYLSSASQTDYTNEIKRNTAIAPTTETERWSGFRTAAIVQNSSNLFVSWSQRSIDFIIKDKEVQLIQDNGTVDGISIPTVNNVNQNIGSLNTTGPGSLQYKTEGKYSYSAWGSWNTNDMQGIYGSDVGFTHSKWVVGKETDPADMPKTGSALYKGVASGHHYQNNVYAGKLNGSVDISADFSSSSVTGNLNLYKENGNNFVNAVIANGKIQDADFLGTLTGFTPDASTTTNSPSIGTTHQTENVIKGSFFGGEAGIKPPEIGGTFNINKDSDEVGVGVFAGEKQ